MDFPMPVRVRWNIDFRGATGRAKRIARHIHDVRPLAVELWIDGPAGLAQLPAVFNEVHKGGAGVALGIRLFPGAADVLRWRYPAPVVWEIPADGPFSAGLPEGAAAMLFRPDDDSVAALPRVLEDFSESSVADLHLANVNAVRALASVGHVPVPTAAKLLAAAAEISRLDLPLPGKRLIVHDFFLWRLLRDRFPAAVGERIEFSGCQAAHALAYVDWEGNVYPCDSLPVRLGNVLETPFEEIWNSPVRVSVASSIRSSPSACADCGAYRGCLAGCRGLAYLSSGTLDAADPGCPGPEGKYHK